MPASLNETVQKESFNRRSFDLKQASVEDTIIVQLYYVYTIFKNMKIEYNNLYTHFIFTTLHRLPVISEKYRERIEKYITGIVNNNDSQLYAIYANPEHDHFAVSRSPKLSEEHLASIIAESSQGFQ